MDWILFVVGFFGVMIFGILAVLSLVKKNGKLKRNGILTGVSLLLFLVGGVTGGDKTSNTASSEAKEPATDEESEPKEEVEDTAEAEETAEEKTEEATEEQTEEKPEEALEETSEISAESIEMAVAIIEGYDLVKDAAISVTGEDIAFAIIVNAAVNKEKAKELGDNFVRALGSNASAQGEGPTKETYGGVYDYYSVQVKVADSSENTIAHGAMNAGTQRISW